MPQWHNSFAEAEPLPMQSGDGHSGLTAPIASTLNTLTPNQAAALRKDAIATTATTPRSRRSTRNDEGVAGPVATQRRNRNSIPMPRARLWFVGLITHVTALICWCKEIINQSLSTLGAYTPVPSGSNESANQVSGGAIRSMSHIQSGLIGFSIGHRRIYILDIWIEV
ncbi:hypothetical protein [Methylobacterium sp. GC_Met_2]|uniref:hypothetical protein n=1 Tax=Methylobacterium sp. GC_Met_2 TaxID=2937376 RepID=UPI00226BB295|nr:hypothetical protein [Methylobacterium sp. GC_Met_2]